MGSTVPMCDSLQSGEEMASLLGRPGAIGTQDRQRQQGLAGPAPLWYLRISLQSRLRAVPFLRCGWFPETDREPLLPRVGPEHGHSPGQWAAGALGEGLVCGKWPALSL